MQGYKLFLAILLLIANIDISSAQNFQQVTHFGVAVCGTNLVNVTGDASYISFSCGDYSVGVTGPYATDYQYRFYTPVQHVRFIILQTELGEEISFYVNNQFYSLSLKNLSSVQNSVKCYTCYDSVYSVTYHPGKLNHFRGIVNQVGCVQIDMILPRIDSVKITHNRASSGADYNFYFLDDTAAYIQEPYNDSVYCQGQQIALPYFTSKQFNNGNTFTVQMSDASGSFSSPVNIGTHADTVGDTILCTIPQNTTPGTGYKFRIVSSSPVRTSPYNDHDSITIKANVTGFSAGGNTPVCTGDTLHLTGTSTSTGVSWSWTGVGGFNSAAEDTFIAHPTTANSGDYILTATLNSTGCSLKDTVTVQVITSPNKPTTGSNAPLCAGGTLNLTGSSTTSGVSYAWVGPGGYSASSQNPTVGNVSATASGNYICTVTANGCSNKDTVVVIINPKPNKPTAGSNSPICLGQTLNLTASTIANATYNWWGPAAFTANTQNPSRANVTASHAGIYHVAATVNGCVSDTDTVSVLINPDPQVNIVATPSNDICDGQTATFVAFTSNAGATPTFQWLLNGTATGNTTTTYSNSNIQSGDLIYCIMSTANCNGNYTDTSNIVNMTVWPIRTPTVSITANPIPPVAPWTLVNFSTTTTNGGSNPTFQWKRNGQDVVGATSNTWGTYQLSDGDVVTVVMHSDYKCAVPDSAMSNAITMQLNLGVNNLTTGSLQLYPNPNNGDFTIKGAVTDNETINLTIINKLGQTVYHTTIKPINNKIDTHININKELPAGVYTLQLNTAKANSSAKIHIR